MTFQSYLGKYTMPNSKTYQFHSKFRTTLNWASMKGTLNFYMARIRNKPQTDSLAISTQPEFVSAAVVSILDSEVGIHWGCTTQHGHHWYNAGRRKANWTSIQKQDLIKKNVQKMLRDGVIEPSSSSGVPVVLYQTPMVPFTFVWTSGVNHKTLLDTYPMPLVHEILICWVVTGKWL